MASKRKSTTPCMVLANEQDPDLEMVSDLEEGPPVLTPADNPPAESVTSDEEVHECVDSDNQKNTNKVEGGYECKYCTFQTPDLNMFTFHVDSEHPNVVLNSSYVCVECSFLTKRYDALSEHNLKYHPGEENFKLTMVKRNNQTIFEQTVNDLTFDGSFVREENAEQADSSEVPSSGISISKTPIMKMMKNKTETKRIAVFHNAADDIPDEEKGTENEPNSEEAVENPPPAVSESKASHSVVGSATAVASAVVTPAPVLQPGVAQVITAVTAPQNSNLLPKVLIPVNSIPAYNTALDNNPLLLNTYNKFPYPAMSEITVLSTQAKYTEEQNKIWFSAQRLKHGVSWTPEEVEEARRKQLNGTVHAVPQTRTAFVTRTLKTRGDAKAAEQAHEENGDLEVRRSCRLRQSRYTATNQSVLFDKLITNTAEAVLQKMDDMEKMRRRRMMEDLGVFHDAEEENLDVYSRGKKEIQRADEEIADNQGGIVVSSEESEEKEDDDGEDTRKRYDFRQRKTVERYQAPLEKPRQRKIYFSGRSSPVRQRYPFRSAQSQGSCCKRTDRRRHAVHNSDSTSSSSSSSSDDEEHFERRRKRSHNRALRRCLPLNFRKDELKGIHKDRMKIGASLADVDPMQIDCSVRFDGVGGLSDHISALKEMVIFPLLYPEVFERFKIQPPRGCLFYGPPGTGKTLVARALANECSQGDRRIAFFMRKGADCLSKWVGESERQLRLLFDQAYQMRPSIIFFDEIDGLAPVRSSKQDQIHSSIVSTLLALMDGLDSRGEIVVIGATNRLDSIDPALRRPGRFDREFLFSLPDKEARKDIFKIHTRDWSPKPLDMFLEELAEKCVGYCGADIKSLCAEAALCALRRRYPQIYKSSEKLQLDIASIKITAKDFVVAMQKTVPASQRTLASPGRALSPISKPLLENTLARILKALQKVFPHAELALKEDQQRDSLSHILRDDVVNSDEELPSIFEEKPTPKMPGRQNEKFLNFSRNAYYQPTSCRPRFLLVGEPGYGQASHLAPAVIHALEKFPVYTLDLSVLFVSITSPEETCAQLMREAQRTAPSIIYIPHIHLWWEAVGATLKATFTTLLQNIPTFAPVLLLATSDVCHAGLPKEIKELFNNDYEEVFEIQLPKKEERRTFFEDLVVNQAAKPPVSKNNAAWRPLEVLPVAPPPEPRQLTEEEIRQLEEQEEDTLRELRIFLRDVTHRLAVDRRFRAFTKPVDPEEVPDYDTVIKQPMDLSAVLSKIDLHQYLTAGDFLKDIDLICSNALEYNPDKDPGDRLIRHRACTLRDTAYAIVREEMDEDFEQCCEEIQESRKKRGCSSSKYAPSYYRVMPKQNAVPGCKKTDPKCNEKTKTPAAPVDSSTPRSNGISKRKRRRNKGSSSIATKRRNFQFNKENKVPEDRNELESDEESLEKHVSNMDRTEVESTQDSSMEENENVLQERQKNGNDTKTGTENERVLLVAKSASEKKSVTLPEHSDRRKGSEMPDCQIAESSEEGDSNGSWVHHMTCARRSRAEEQQVIRVEKAVEILTQPVTVDYCELKQLLHFVTVITKNFNIFHLEKLYAVLSQCIYQHREDYDKTELVKEMKKEISAFSYAQ